MSTETVVYCDVEDCDRKCGTTTRGRFNEYRISVVVGSHTDAAGSSASITLDADICDVCARKLLKTALTAHMDHKEREVFFKDHVGNSIRPRK